MSLTGFFFRSIMLTMMNMNGVAEMYAIQNHKGRFYEGTPNAYSWTTIRRFAREWVTEAEAESFKKEHKIRGNVVKLERA